MALSIIQRLRNNDPTFTNCEVEGVSLQADHLASLRSAQRTARSNATNSKKKCVVQ